MYQEKHDSSFLVGLVLGAAAGLAIGLLLAPKPGVETRKIVLEGISSGMERVRELRDED